MLVISTAFVESSKSKSDSPPPSMSHTNTSTGEAVLDDNSIFAAAICLVSRGLRDRSGIAQSLTTTINPMSHDEGMSGDQNDSELVDPDPFTIGLGIFSAVAGGGTFLEARRARENAQNQQRDNFRAAWYGARRTLIHFKQQIDEFETYMLEDDYGRKTFRIGSVRLMVDRGRHQAHRR